MKPTYALLFATLATIALAEPSVPFQNKPLQVKEKVIALTFDDGPVPGATSEVLEALKKRGFRATFCVLGQRLAENPELAKAYIAEGHELANHSWDHPHFTKLTDEEAREQLRRTEEAILALTQQKPSFFRPPYFSMDERKAAIVQGEFGYKILYDSLNSKDWVRPSPTQEETIQWVVESVRPGDIILLHESFPNTVQAMPALVEALASKGFRSVTVTELLALAAEQ